MLMKKVFGVIATICCLTTFSANANIIVTWENSGGDLVIRWDGFIDNWTRTNNFDSNTVILQNGNGMHALGGNVDLIWTGSTHNWFSGGTNLSGGILAGDSFGTSGNATWVYMPGNYAGEVISGSATFLGAGNYVDLGYFFEGSRDLGFGDNDNIIFQAYQRTSVPEPAMLGLFSLALLALGRFKRRQ